MSKKRHSWWFPIIRILGVLLILAGVVVAFAILPFVLKTNQEAYQVVDSWGGQGDAPG